MFRGTHTTRLDEKGRLKVPADFKRQIDENYGAQFYITSRDGNCCRSLSHAGMGGDRAQAGGARRTRIQSRRNF